VQPDSGVLPLAHWQSVTVARWLRLRESAPARANALWARLGADAGHRWTRAKLKDSTRHWFEVSHVDYLRALQKVLNELEPVA
jgi:hypothetical protein